MLSEISYCVVNFTSTEPIYAWIWFLIPAAIALFAGTIVVIAANSSEVDGKTLGVLGMREAGKTQLYRTLQKRAYNSYQGTGTDDYESFTFKYGDKVITVKKGRDIGGGENYIREYYKEMIETKDIIFFVFNAARYINESSYAMDVKNRMDFIWRHMKSKYGSNDVIKTKLVTVGSHLDKIPESKHGSLVGSFQQDIAGKPYYPMFHENFLVANLTDHDKFMNELISRKIFG